MAKLTAQYNEYGYVIFKSSRPIYAAGNSPFDSQGYIGSKRVEPRWTGAVAEFSRDPIAEDADVLGLESIAKYCESTLADMFTRPELYNLKPRKGVEVERGSAKFASSLNPLEQAYKCGSLVV